MKNLKNYLKTRVEKFIRLGEVYTNAYSMQTAVYYIRSRFAMFVAMLMLGIVVSACGGNDDDDASNNTSSAEDGIYSTQDDERKISEILSNYQEVTGLSGQSVGDFTVKVYARNANLHVGYNDIYFTVEKTENGRHVKDFSITELSPLMDMGKMKHSTPTTNQFDQIESLPIYHAWIAPLMAGKWTLPFSYRIKGTTGTFEGDTITVETAPEGVAWIKSFKWNDATYYLTLAHPHDLKTGVNTLTAYVSKKGENGTLPYLPAKEKFTIEIYPTMPDMGDHTSPNNEALTLQDDGSYQGKLNLTMTGLWDIHLNVKDAEGNTVAGGEELSSLFWKVEI